MAGYGQFCPVAKAMDVLDERWTLLVVRELLVGSTHFNELRRGNPRMSPALLAKRLRTLERAGVVRRDEVGGRPTYRLTAAGEELRPVVESLGAWGARWVADLGDEDLDPHLLFWDVRRTVPTTSGRARRPRSSSGWTTSIAGCRGGGSSCGRATSTCATSTPVSSRRSWSGPGCAP